MIPLSTDLNKKWWHRFSKVIIWIITLCLGFWGIFMAYICIGTRGEFILSFQENYSSHKGIEYSIKDTTIWEDRILDRISEINPNIQSKIPNLNSPTLPKEVDTLKTHDESIATSSRYSKQDLLREFGETTTNKVQEAKQVSLINGPKDLISYYKKKYPNADGSSILNFITEYYPNIKIKEWEEYKVNWSYFIPLAMTGPLSYLILWLIYNKIFLYIIYGNK